MDLYVICDAFTKLKMYPVFEIAHYVLTAITMRKDLISSVTFSYERRHPLASWLSTLLLCFAGGISNCVLFGKPLASLLTSPDRIAGATLVWYLVNYVPGLYKLLTTRPLMTVIVALKEVHRVYGISAGLTEARAQYPSHYLVHFVAGFLRGTAGEIMMFGARLAAGILKPNTHQFVAPNVFLYPSSVFKASAVISTLFCLEHLSILRVEHRLLFTSIILVAIYFRLSMIWGIMGDPFVPFENLFCSIVFGGMWEAYQRVVRDERSSTHVGGANGDTHHHQQKVKKS